MKALPSIFRGVTYRSRVEARWAIFLHELGVKAQWEPDGFDLGGVPYMPDFYVIAWDIYIEVKGAVPTGAERHKCQLLAEASGKPVLLAIGDPATGLGEWFTPGFPHDEIPTGNARIAKCRKCERTVVALSYGPAGDDGYGWHNLDGECVKKPNCTDKEPVSSTHLEAAAAKACAHRFEVAA